MDLIIFIVLASVGGALGSKLKIPAGVLIGSMVMVGLWQGLSFFDPLYIDEYVKWIGQCLLGLTMGLMFKKNSLNINKTLMYFLVIFGVLNIFYSAFLAYMIQHVTDLSYLNTFIAVIPGGLAEMLILTDSLNEDTSAVALFHLVRLFLLLIILPKIMKVMVKNNENYK